MSPQQSVGGKYGNVTGQAAIAQDLSLVNAEAIREACETFFCGLLGGEVHGKDHLSERAQVVAATKAFLEEEVALGVQVPKASVNPSAVSASDQETFYHRKVKYAGPALPIRISGGGQDPMKVDRPDGKFGCSLCSSVLTTKQLLYRHFAIHTVGEFECPFVLSCGCTELRFHRWDKFRDHLKKRHTDVGLNDPTVIEVFMRYHRGSSAQLGKLGQNQRVKRLTKKEKEARQAADEEQLREDSK